MIRNIEYIMALPADDICYARERMTSDSLTYLLTHLVCDVVFVILASTSYGHKEDT